jgi:hypothetical protein
MIKVEGSLNNKSGDGGACFCDRGDNGVVGEEGQ